MNRPPDPQPPPHPDPDRGHLLARTGVRWTIIGVLISAVLTVVGWVVQAQLNHQPHTGGGPSPIVSTASNVSGPSETATPPADGLTTAEHELRDSLNSDQWQRQSCEHDKAPGAKAALLCSVTTEGGTLKADIVTYLSKDKLQEVYRTYARGLPLGNCDVSRNVHGSWHEKDSTMPTGDMACFTLANGQYLITCTYYDRPALFQVRYASAEAITRWWQTLDPVFRTG
ncbi:hypothetical protein BX283_0451 [Streptomyces sp. TLI_146]|nr:hypothetical protein BX283_0451 [Streptomyces sp. TLI_146]